MWVETETDYTEASDEIEASKEIEWLQMHLVEVVSMVVPAEITQGIDSELEMDCCLQTVVQVLADSDQTCTNSCKPNGHTYDIVDM